MCTCARALMMCTSLFEYQNGTKSTCQLSQISWNFLRAQVQFLKCSKPFEEKRLVIGGRLVY